MTRSETEVHVTGQRSPRRRIGRLAIATLAGSLIGLVTTSVSEVSARANTSSEVIGDEAAAAVSALDRWETSSLTSDYTAFVAARNEVATAVAYSLQVPAASLSEAWAAASFEKQHVMLAAMTQLGVPYRSRASKAGVGFDCSGLVRYAYEQAGIELPRSSGEQFKASIKVDEDEAQPGDVVFYPGHISLYVGLGLVVHSPQPGMDVEIRGMFDRAVKYGDLTNALIAATADH